MKKVLFWGAVLIGGYLVVSHATGSSRILASSGKSSVNLVKAFQGR